MSVSVSKDRASCLKYNFISVWATSTLVETQHNNSGAIHSQPDECSNYTVCNYLQLCGAWGSLLSSFLQPLFQVSSDFCIMFLSICLFRYQNVW